MKEPLFQPLPDIRRVKCDACDKTVEIEYRDYGDINKRLIALGWLVGEGEYCPDCAALQRSDEQTA